MAFVCTDFSIQALPWPKIALLNFDIRQYSYSERLILSKRHLKEVYVLNLKKILWAIFHWGNHFRNHKLEYQILVPINIFVVSYYFFRKDIWKGIIICFLKKIIQVDFLDTHFRNLKFVCQIWTSTKFSAVNDQYILNNM